MVTILIIMLIITNEQNKKNRKSNSINTNINKSKFAEQLIPLTAL